MMRIKIFVVIIFGVFACTISYNPSPEEETLPNILYYVPPVYPQEALDKKIEGTVVAKVHIDLKGNVVAIEIIEPAHPLLDHAFYVAAKEWKYDPMDLKKIKTIVVERYSFWIPELHMIP
jgi:TonB family protein